MHCFIFAPFFKVLRAQNLVAAESGFSGQTRPGTLYPPSGVPSTCPRKISDNQERMVIPQGLRHSLPSSENTMTARQKIQAKIDSEVFIIPKRDDTKRFQPSQVCELYSKLFAFINRVDNVNWPPSIFSTADISSVSPFVRTDARNVDFRKSLLWPVYIINSGDKTKSSYNTPTDTASLQPYPLYSEWFACDCCDNIDLLEFLSLKLSLCFQKAIISCEIFSF